MEKNGMEKYMIKNLESSNFFEIKVPLYGYKDSTKNNKI